MIRISCKEASASLARGEARGLRLRLHLLVCRFCRSFERQLRLIERALASSVFPVADAGRVRELERAALERLRGM